MPLRGLFHHKLLNPVHEHILRVLNEGGVVNPEGLAARNENCWLEASRTGVTPAAALETGEGKNAGKSLAGTQNRNLRKEGKASARIGAVRRTPENFIELSNDFWKKIVAAHFRGKRF